MEFTPCGHERNAVYIADSVKVLRLISCYLKSPYLLNRPVTILSLLRVFSFNFDIGNYCGIIIVRGGSIFLAFVNDPCPQIYIPTNENITISLIFEY